MAFTLMSGVNYPDRRVVRHAWRSPPRPRTKGLHRGVGPRTPRATIPLRCTTGTSISRRAHALQVSQLRTGSAPVARAAYIPRARNAREPGDHALAGWWGNDPATSLRDGPGLPGSPEQPTAAALNRRSCRSRPYAYRSRSSTDRGRDPPREEPETLTAIWVSDRPYHQRRRATPGAGHHAARRSKARGCRLSLAVAERTREVHAPNSKREGVVCDFPHRTSSASPDAAVQHHHGSGARADHWKECSGTDERSAFDS